ncbi:MAG: hypothetical protein GC181_15200 [Bacteroidetes bacterium]|nr:hypothetical protein [Bacteroidota bacterium]
MVPCLYDISATQFGVSDANSNIRNPAKVLIDSQVDWDVTFENNVNGVQYKAVDYCIDIYRTGTYNVKDDNSDPVDFSSDRIDNLNLGLIKRCEGLIKNEKFILFFEIKKGLYKNWLKDARRKFEETILSFKEHHPDLESLLIEPIIVNKLFHRVHQNEMMQKRILKDKIGLDFRVVKTFSISDYE